MPTVREKARNTVNYLRIAPRQAAGLRKERTLNIDAPPPWPPDWVAQYVLRVALENECTKIRVRQGVHVDRTFDVMDLCTYTRLHLYGHLPRPKMKLVPAKLATIRHMALGNHVQPMKGSALVTVPQLPVSIMNGG